MASMFLKPLETPPGDGLRFFVDSRIEAFAVKDVADRNDGGLAGGVGGGQPCDAVRLDEFARVASSSLSASSMVKSPSPYPLPEGEGIKERKPSIRGILGCSLR